ncbi:hypothetical protein U9M48_002666 [Paspalum notatum var. saurae]|uniref:Neprosin PEP catalytic domain-containing protein n=1 Tax=Paspalum notatum var. saurae TaxID=547442 RepID=A0AAQ3SHL9_PASNO
MAMTARACVVALVVMAVTILCFERAAAAGTAGRSDVQRLLRRLNKPPVATIQSPDGDTIDCVHISKQPAFDNPILKNHTIQMWPSSHPRGLNQDANVAPRPFMQTWHKNGKCPENTIPIRRTKEEDVLRANSVSSYGKKRSKFTELAVTTGHQWAEASAQGANNYYGTEANINLWQPIVETASDFSLTQFWVTSGSYQNNDLNTIEVGWQVYPQMYGDNCPKLFIYWTRDAYQTTGCYDLKCSGFVQTNNNIAFGVSQLTPLSTYGGSQYDINILVWKDPATGNWWLQISNEDIGYWPSSIFTNLASSASSVTWGGEVFSSDAGQTSTQMGSGHLPNEGFGKASYIRNIQVVDASNTLRSPSSLGLFASRPNCYNVEMGGAGTNWGTYFYYGGPGRNANCQ